MIQTATLPAAAKLLLAAGVPAATGESAAFDAQFSALLAASFIAPADLAPGKTDAATAPELPFKAQPRPASGGLAGKASGKAPGKILPESPALAAFAAMLKDLRGSASAKGDSGSEVIAAPTDQTAAVPVSLDPAFFPNTEANDIAAALPLPVAAPAQRATLAATRTQPAAAAVPFQPSNAAASIQPGSDQPSAVTDPAQPERTADPRFQLGSFIPDALKGIALLEPIEPALTDRAPASLASALPAMRDSPSSEEPQSRPETTPVVIQSGLTTRVVLVPRSQAPFAELGKLQTMAIEQAKTGEAGAQIAKVQVRQMPEARTTPMLAPIAPAAEPAGKSTPEPARTQPRHSSETELAQETPRTAFACLDAAPLLAADPGTATDTSSAGATGPAALAAPSRTPDFAALIDRLVEARAAAQATREPHTVSAAIEHADFGQVSLQFRHDAIGLSVVMASADPDLARALQMAAPSGGSLGGQFTGSGEGSGPQWRQDASSQQSAFTSQPQLQSQSQSSQHRGPAPQRAPDQQGASANPSPRPRSQADQPQRSGIFA